MSGREYDEYAGDYTPNKDRRIKEWREKKAAKKKEDSEAIARRAASSESAKEERRELAGPVTATPITSSDSTLLDAINNGTSGAPAVKPRRRKDHFTAGTDHPTLF